MNTHSVTNKQKGRVGEALLTSHSGYATEIVEDWIINEVRTSPNVTDEDPVRVTHDHRVETYYVQYEGDHMSWTPDCLFSAWVAKEFGPLQSSDERRIDFPVEVKTGKYAELERNQRTVMELLATRSDVAPVVAAIDISDLPDQFGVNFRRISPPEATAESDANH